MSSSRMPYRWAGTILRLQLLWMVLNLAGCYSVELSDCDVGCAVSGVCGKGFECRSGYCVTPEFSGTCNNPLAIKSKSSAYVNNCSDVELTFAAAGGDGSYLWHIDPVQLPKGLKLDAASGELSGRVADAGIYPLAVTVRDQHTSEDTAPFLLDVQNCLPETLPSACAWVAYSEAVAFPGGSSMTVEGLPNDISLTLDTDAAEIRIAGTPVRAGTYTLEFALDTPGIGKSYQQVEFVVNDCPAVLANQLPLQNCVDEPVNWPLATERASSTDYSWSARTEGDGQFRDGLPEGLTLAGGRITGSFTQAGTYIVQLRAENMATGDTSEEESVFNVNVCLDRFPKTEVPISACIKQAFERVLPPPSDVSQGKWEKIGQWPEWLGLSADGLVKGSSEAQYKAKLQAKLNGQGRSTGAWVNELAVNIRDAAECLAITTDTLSSICPNVDQSVQLEAKNVQGDSKWTLAKGATKGLSLTPAGELKVDGSEVASGSYQLVVRLTDSTGTAAEQELELEIRDACVTFTPEELPPACQGQPYTAQLSVQGSPGSEPIWGVIGASWLKMEGDRLTGEPPPGVDHVAIAVSFRQGAGRTAQQNYDLKIRACKFAFLGADGAGPGRLFLGDIQAGHAADNELDPIELSSGLHGLSVRSFDFSPDGSTLAFIADDAEFPSAESRVFVVNMPPALPDVQELEIRGEAPLHVETLAWKRDNSHLSLIATNSGQYFLQDFTRAAVSDAGAESELTAAFDAPAELVTWRKDLFWLGAHLCYLGEDGKQNVTIACIPTNGAGVDLQQSTKVLASPRSTEYLPNVEVRSHAQGALVFLPTARPQDVGNVSPPFPFVPLFFDETLRGFDREGAILDPTLRWIAGAVPPNNGLYLFGASKVQVGFTQLTSDDVSASSGQVDCQEIIAWSGTGGQLACRKQLNSNVTLRVAQLNAAGIESTSAFTPEDTPLAAPAGFVNTKSGDARWFVYWSERGLQSVDLSAAHPIPAVEIGVASARHLAISTKPGNDRIIYQSGSTLNLVTIGTGDAQNVLEPLSASLVFTAPECNPSQAASQQNVWCGASDAERSFVVASDGSSVLFPAAGGLFAADLSRSIPMTWKAHPATVTCPERVTLNEEETVDCRLVVKFQR